MPSKHLKTASPRRSSSSTQSTRTNLSEEGILASNLLPNLSQGYMRVLDDEIRATHPSKVLRVSNVVILVVFALFQVVFDTTQYGVSDLEMASRYPTPLTPAIWAFAIRVGIFALQLLGVGYQLLSHGYKSDGMKQRYVNGIGYGWQLAWAAETLWQALFMLDSPLGVGLCLACVLLALLAMARTLYNMYRLKQEHGSLSNILMYVAFFLPTSIHTAWLSMTGANAILMVPVAFDYSFLLEAMAVVLAILVTSIGIYIVQTQRDSAYGLTLVWVLVAIYGQQLSALIRGVCLVCICAAILASIFSMLRRKNQASAESAETRQPLSHMNSF